MGVSCQILINKTREGVYMAGGEPVTGVVRYHIDERTEYQDVTLSFIGKAKCSWSEGSDSSSYQGTENFITRHINITNKTPGETITLNPGAYEYPFEFYLPEDIPSSFREKTGSVAYKIQLKFVKASMLSLNKKFTTEITVYGYVRSNPTLGSAIPDGPVIFGLEKTLKAPFAAKPLVVNLKAEIAKTCLIPGENVHLYYKVTNDTDSVITSVKTELYCCTTFTADCGRTTKKQEKVRDCKVETRPIPERKVREFNFTLPTRGELYSIQHSRVISREYRVRVTVRLPLPHLNATVEMPIVVGERALSCSRWTTSSMENKHKPTRPPRNQDPGPQNRRADGRDRPLTGRP